MRPRATRRVGEAATGGVPMHAGRARSAAGALAGVAITLLIACLAMPAGALAGEWEQDSCANPNASAAGSQGWSAMIAGGAYGSTTGTGCGPGSPAFALLSTLAPVAVGSSETLHYMPPAGSTLEGGLVNVALFADGRGYGSSGTAVAYTPEFAYDASDVFFQCAAGLTPCSGATNDFSGTLEIPGGRGGSLYLSAGCGSGYNTGSCDEGGSEGAWSLVRLYWAQLLLSNSSVPTASGFAGPLLAGNARGTSELVLTAGDPEGPGVYEVLVQADGHTLYDGTPDRNGGACAAVGSSGATLMFDASQPCKRTETVDLPIDTTLLSDGSHTLKVTVTDAAQNSSVVYDAPVSSQNAPLASTAPSVQEAAPAVGETLSGQAGAWTAPPGAETIGYAYQWQSCEATGASCRSIPGAVATSYTAGTGDVGHTLRLLVTASNADGASALASAPTGVVVGIGGAAAPIGAANGRGASEHAQIALRGPGRLLRRYGERALKLSGTLTDGHGGAIAGATLDVLAQTSASAGQTLLGHLTSGTDGTFAAQVPAGPSRQVQIAYRAYAGAPAYAAQAAIAETVLAGVSLSVTPRHTRPVGMITLSGQVAGPLPAHGVVVELLVHYRGAWEPFRDARTGRGGRFSVRYHFEGAIGRFPFRAKVLGEQGGFPYATGLSRVLDVQSD